MENYSLKDRKFKHINSLDTLRGFSVILVLMLHGSYGFFTGGWIGVDVFFVISGFLITSILINENNRSKTISITNFYYRRFLRLFPPLILGLIIANILWNYSNIQAPANKFTATVAAVFYYLNLIPENLRGNLAHLWSLSIEEQFYLFWPLMLILIIKLEVKKQLYILIFLIILIMIFRFFIFNYYLPQKEDFFVITKNGFTFCRIDSLILGAFLSILYINNYLKSDFYLKYVNYIIPIIIFIYFLIVIFLKSENAIYENGGYILINLLCFYTVLIAVKNPNHIYFSNKFIKWIGVRSYGIYIYHFPIFIFLETFRIHENTLNLISITLLRLFSTLIVAQLSFKYIEKPILLLKIKSHKSN